MPWWVYIVECRDRSLYTGITNNLDARVGAHNDGRGARYTRSRRPVRLLWSERKRNRSSALRREAEIKSWTREEKLRQCRIRK
jgi:putative endonuclease